MTVSPMPVEMSRTSAFWPKVETVADGVFVCLGREKRIRKYM